MENKYKNGITDDAPALNTSGIIAERKKLVELVRKYNPDFTDGDFTIILNDGTLDFFGTATGQSPTDSSSYDDADSMQTSFMQIREYEQIHAVGGELGEVSDMLPSSEPMSIIQPMKDGGETDEVKFIEELGGNTYYEYKEEQIMFVPMVEGLMKADEYYVGDNQFDSMEDAKSFIDKGSPMSQQEMDMHQHGVFKGGGETKSQSKFNKVMHEWGQGTLRHGTTDEIVPKDRQDMALAIAFSEAREIYPKFGIHEDGGESHASGGGVRRYNLPVNDNYEVITSYYTGGIEEGAEICENCGKTITNIAVIKNSQGDKYNVGLDCAETLSNVEGLYNVEMDFAELKALRAKINKTIKEGKKVEFEIYNNGDLLAKHEHSTIFIKDIEFSKKYLSQYLKEVSNPRKIGFIYTDKHIKLPFERLVPRENKDFSTNFKVDDYDVEVSVQPYTKLNSDEISGYDFFTKVFENSDEIYAKRSTMYRNIVDDVNYAIRKHEFELYDNPNGCKKMSNGDSTYAGGGDVEIKIKKFQKLIDDPRSSKEEIKKYTSFIEKLKTKTPSKDKKMKKEKSVKTVDSKKVNIDGKDVSLDSQEFCDYLLGDFKDRRKKAEERKGKKIKTTSVMAKVNANIEKGVEQAVKEGIKAKKKEILKNPKVFLGRVRKLETSTKSFLQDLKDVMGSEYDGKEVNTTIKSIKDMIDELKKKME